MGDAYSENAALEAEHEEVQRRRRRYRFDKEVPIPCGVRAIRVCKIASDPEQFRLEFVAGGKGE